MFVTHCEESWIRLLLYKDTSHSPDLKCVPRISTKPYNGLYGSPQSVKIDRYLLFGVKAKVNYKFYRRSSKYLVA